MLRTVCWPIKDQYLNIQHIYLFKSLFIHILQRISSLSPDICVYSCSICEGKEGLWTAWGFHTLLTAPVTRYRHQHINARPWPSSRGSVNVHDLRLGHSRSPQRSSRSQNVICDSNRTGVYATSTYAYTEIMTSLGSRLMISPIFQGDSCFSRFGPNFVQYT